MSKSVLSAPQSEISGAVLAVRMVQKVKQELYTIHLKPSVFFGDLEIVLRMIAKNDPVDLPIFYRTRIMKTTVLTCTDNWSWCPGTVNPADFLIRNGSTLEDISSDFWLLSSFLPTPEISWPVKFSASLLSISSLPTVIKRTIMVPDNPFLLIIRGMMDTCGSYSKVLNALTLLLKKWIITQLSRDTPPTWNAGRNSISSSIVSCFKPAADLFISKNKLKHLVVQLQDVVHYFSDRSFRLHMGVPLICGTTVLTRCIVKDAHVKLGHSRYILQLLHNILSEFYIPGVRKMITQIKISYPGCLRLNKKSFSSFAADIPDLIKTVQPPFLCCQDDIFGPILAYNDTEPLKCWVLVSTCA